MTRVLDLFGSALADLGGDDLVAAIRAAEGRTVMAEVVAGAPPLLAGTSNAELVSAFGADLVCLNLLDPAERGRTPVQGLEALDAPPTSLAALAGLLGRPVGLNLEPDTEEVPPPFRATEAVAGAAHKGGAAFVMITANPGRNATIADLATAVEVVRSAAPGLACFAGKMHHAGRAEALTADVSQRLAEAGANGVLVPLPGTVPGMSETAAAGMVAAAHSLGAIAIGTIGTSQEGADEDTMRALALAGKRIGVDVHHIGDAGFTGVARPEGIYAYSVAIRGIRHTWNRMARGVRASWTGKEL